MRTLSEKISFALTGLGYLLFHLGKAPGNGSIVAGTLMALMYTLPFVLGFTYLAVVLIRRFTGQYPPWDRILRIMFTIGILLGLVNALYIRGALEQERQQRGEISAACCAPDNSRSAPWYSP